MEMPCEEPNHQESDHEPHPHYSELPSVRAQMAEAQAQAQKSQGATQVKQEPSYPPEQYYKKEQTY